MYFMATAEHPFGALHGQRLCFSSSFVFRAADHSLPSDDIDRVATCMLSRVPPSVCVCMCVCLIRCISHPPGRVPRLCMCYTDTIMFYTKGASQPMHPRLTIPYHAIPYHVMPCHVMSCHTIMPCHTMPCHVIPYHTITIPATVYATVDVAARGVRMALVSCVP